MSSFNKIVPRANGYAKITVVAGGNGATASPGSSLLENGGNFISPGYYNNGLSDTFTVSVQNRTNAHNLYYVITGVGAVHSRFYQSRLSSTYYTNPDGSSGNVNSLSGGLGRGTNTAFNKQCCIDTTNSNTLDTSEITTFAIEVRDGSTTGPVLATSQTISVYRWRFNIDVFNDTTGLYQAATYTYPLETQPGNVNQNRNIYCRVNLPSRTAYFNQSLFSPNPGFCYIENPASGTSAATTNDAGLFMNAQGFWENGTDFGHIWYANAIYKDATTEAIEYFRFAFYWPNNGGVKYSHSNDMAIAANTT